MSERNHKLIAMELNWLHSPTDIPVYSVCMVALVLILVLHLHWLQNLVLLTSQKAPKIPLNGFELFQNILQFGNLRL